MHKYKVHGIKRFERRLIDVTHCPVCLLEFWSRERVINHLCDKSDTCRNHLLLRAVPMSVEDADELYAHELSTNIRSAAAKNRKRYFAKKLWG